MILLTEFGGVWAYGFHFYPWDAFAFVTQNYWLMPTIDFWWLGNNCRSEVLNFFW